MSERGNSLLRNLDKFAGIPLTVPAALYRHATAFTRKRTWPPRHAALLCPGAIGDLLLLTALLDGLRKQLPGAKIDVILSSANAQAAPLLPGVDASFSFPVKRVDKFVRHLISKRYDVLFDASQWARFGNIVCNLSQAGLTLGFQTAGQFRSLGYDIRVPHRSDLHELDNFLALGKALWPDFTGSPHIVLPKCRGEGESGLVYCHMWPAGGAGARLKQWPEKMWAGLIGALCGKNYQVRLTGAPAEAPRTEAFCREYFPNSKNARSIAGKVPLAELASLFSRSAAVISVNTGIMHLAAISGAPTIGLHGATNPLRWGPVGPRIISLSPRYGRHSYLDLGFEYPKNAENSLPNLPVEDVLAAFEKISR